MIVKKVIAAAMMAGGLMLAGALPGHAADTVERTVTIKDHTFDPTQIKVPAGARVILTVKNEDATPEEFESNELRVEKVITGNGSGIVRFGPLKAGIYPFFGEFHQATALGAVVAE